MNRALAAARAWLRAAPVAVLLTIVAAASSLSAWSLQASAAADLQEAKRLQSAEVGQDGGEPPSASQNRLIIGALDESIEVRRQIDEQLQRIEASVAALSESQRSAGAVTDRALSEIRKIAAELGGAGRAAGFAVGRLGALRGKLQRAAVLAEKIADELAELDRKMGPSAGRP